MSEKSKTFKVTITAVMTAVVCMVTLFIQVPIPLGYFNIGNTVILLACMIVDSPYGIVIGAVGSALADLLSYPVYTLPTFVIKAVFPLVFYIIYRRRFGSVQVRRMVAAGVATLIPLFGYTATGMVLYGGFFAGLAQFPGLFLEYVANLVLFGITSVAVSKAFRL